MPGRFTGADEAEGRWFTPSAGALAACVLCSVPNTRALIDNGVEYKTEYLDSKGNYITTTTATRRSCLEVDPPERLL